MGTIPSVSAGFIGRVLGERYRLDLVLGTGGMGAVYQARDLQSDATLAVKLLHQLGPGSEEHQQRFFDEALIIGQLFHPNIVQVIGFDKDGDGRPFLIMELLRGKDLYDVLEERKKLPIEKALEITRQVAAALHAAHAVGVAHRDIKPSNIFLSRQRNSDGEEVEVIKVVDFGLSKEIDNKAGRRTAPGIILGTVEYVSPEGTTGESEQVDFRSDQWSLAVVTYRMLSGQLPFAGKNLPGLLNAIRHEKPTPLRTHLPEVPKHVEDAIERAMAKDKAQRFESVQDFVRALSGLPVLSKALGSAADGSRVGLSGRRPSSSANLAPLPPEARPQPPAETKPAETKPAGQSRTVLFGLIGLLIVLALLSIPLWLKLAARSHGSAPPGPGAQPR